MSDLGRGPSTWGQPRRSSDRMAPARQAAATTPKTSGRHFSFSRAAERAITFVCRMRLNLCCSLSKQHISQGQGQAVSGDEQQMHLSASQGNEQPTQRKAEPDNCVTSAAHKVHKSSRPAVCESKSPLPPGSESEKKKSSSQQQQSWHTAIGAASEPYGGVATRSLTSTTGS